MHGVSRGPQTDKRRYGWGGWVQNRANLDYHTKEFEEKGSGNLPMFVLLSLEYVEIITTEYCGFSIQFNYQLRHWEIYCHYQQWKTPKILGSSFWQVKDQGGTSSRPGAHAIFWPWSPQNLQGFCSVFFPKHPNGVLFFSNYLSSFLYHLLNK